MRKKIPIIVCLLFSIAFLVQAGVCFARDAALRLAFRARENHTDYMDGLPIAEMDFAQYAWYLSKPTNPVGYSIEYALPYTLRYYREADGKKEPAREIPAGTVVEVEAYAPTGGLILGYGFKSFPTYERGWRWVRPFCSDKNVEPEELGWYYIKTADLERLAEHYVHNTPRMQDSARNAGLSEGQAASAFILQYDKIFYERGVYISPDLRPVFWTWWSVLSAAGALLSLVWLLLLKLKKRKQG